MSQIVLILGGTGRFGRHATRAFTDAGWQVRQFNRQTDTLDRAMIGADVVLMGWNPGGYHLWEKQLVGLHDRVARAAKRAGATVIVPGNVYVYGPDAPTPWRPDTPHMAQNPLGRLRREAEATYRHHGTRTIILRCGDFIDGADSGNWFESHIAKTVPKGFIRYPGDPDAPHAWAYLPDAARAAVALAEARDRLAEFEDVPFEGYTLSGNALADTISRSLAQPVAVRPFPWGLLRLMSPVMPLMAGLLEMRYLWSLPQRLDGARLAELVPEYQPTPPEVALRAALTDQAGGAIAA